MSNEIDKLVDKIEESKLKYAENGSDLPVANFVASSSRSPSSVRDSVSDFFILFYSL